MSRRWVIAAAALGIGLGVTAGLGGYTFIYAQGASSLTNDAAACANCHVMSDHYAAWTKSSHHAVAVCNDCHAPQDFFGKYWTKARNGYSHSLDFTTGRFHEPISAEIIQERTHQLREIAMVALMDLITDLKASKTAGASDERLAPARDFQRKAQFLLDFVEAENSSGFHAGQEAARLLGISINNCRKGHTDLRGIRLP